MSNARPCVLSSSTWPPRRLEAKKYRSTTYGGARTSLFVVDVVDDAVVAVVAVVVEVEVVVVFVVAVVVVVVAVVVLVVEVEVEVVVVAVEVVVTISIVDVELGSGVVVVVSMSRVSFVVANEFRYSIHVMSVKEASVMVESDVEG